MKFINYLPSLLTAVAVAASPVLIDESFCPGAKVVSESFIGKDKNVKVQNYQCQSLSDDVPHADILLGRATNVLNVCGTHCNDNCFTPSGGGPDPNECHVIADALRFEGQNTGAIFQVQNGTVTGNPTVMLYRSCRTFFVNQDSQPLEFCRTRWAEIIDDVAFNCQSAQNAHGGNCVADDQRWFVQVQSNTA